VPDQHGDEFVVSDPELIARVRAGDREAFGELYRRHAGPATTLARQFARSAAESDDLVSESFARVLDNLLAGKGPDTAFRAYLFTTVRNTAYDRTLRRQPPSGAGRLSSGSAPGPEVACPSARRPRSTRTWRSATGAGRWPRSCRRSTPGCAPCWHR
jgi:DNA-directed RNA polymerase specialized sigma24 family protein